MITTVYPIVAKIDASSMQSVVLPVPLECEVRHNPFIAINRRRVFAASTSSGVGFDGFEGFVGLDDFALFVALEVSGPERSRVLLHEPPCIWFC
jgi:hypothetical protein